MSQLPEAKLDVLLARHAALEAEVLGQVSAEHYVRMTRELAELNPVVEAVKAWRAIGAEIADLDTLIADAATDADMRAMAATGITRLIECGPGKVLTGMNRRIEKGLECLALEDPASLEAVLTATKGAPNA